MVPVFVRNLRLRKTGLGDSGKLGVRVIFEEAGLVEVEVASKDSGWCGRADNGGGGLPLMSS